MTPSAPSARLRKELGLFDVYAISTGAMFSSGFFLLPGLAAAQTGPSVPLAYLVAGLFILPPMLSVAELSTAMPRAGGAYYFLDRALGPLVGTVGGLGTWLALILKTAFALVGMGAYLAIYVEIPIEPLAIALTVVFTIVNIVGAKETSGLQRGLVTILLGVLFFFLVQGTFEIVRMGLVETARERFTPFFPFGLSGFMGTVGFVFVSYAGLTKVASVSEEVRDPDRNIPLGMGLSLATATFVYTLGVWILVAVLPPEDLRADLTPVATAAQAFFDWLPGGIGVLLIVIAAIAAFASTGNAGIMSASRYPLAMARDRLVSPRFAVLGRFQTPTFSILVTSGVIVGSILLFDVASIAKLASAFQLVLFSLLSISVVIMRESGIDGYDPGYRSPLYPWMQIAGFLAPMWLIAEMGQLAILFTLGLFSVTLAWYFWYAAPKVERSGAILHAFARLGRGRYGGLERELRSIVAEKGLREEDPFEEIVARATVLDLADSPAFDDLVRIASEALAERTGVAPSRIAGRLRREVDEGFLPIAHGVALPHLRLSEIDRPMLLIARCRHGVRAEEVEDAELRSGIEGVRAVFFLLSPAGEPGRHLRLLGHLATFVDSAHFMENWLSAKDQAGLKRCLLAEERLVTIPIVATAGGRPEWAGRRIRDLDLPKGTLVALVHRGQGSLVPAGSTELREGDQLTVIGTTAGLRTLERRQAAEITE